MTNDPLAVRSPGAPASPANVMHAEEANLATLMLTEVACAPASTYAAPALFRFVSR
jgi:hypothetical protein